MQMVGWLMIALFVWLFHGPWLAFKRAVDSDDWPSAGASLNRGLASVAVVASARGVGGKIPISSRQADAALVSVAAGIRLLPFAPADWVDIVDAAPIPVGVNFGATRHRQMIEQGGQGAFRTVHSQ
jgi:hypothetical protein